MLYEITGVAHVIRRADGSINRLFRLASGGTVWEHQLKGWL